MVCMCIGAREAVLYQCTIGGSAQHITQSRGSGAGQPRHFKLQGTLVANATCRSHAVAVQVRRETAVNTVAAHTCGAIAAAHTKCSSTIGTATALRNCTRHGSRQRVASDKCTTNTRGQGQGPLPTHHASPASLQGRPWWSPGQRHAPPTAALPERQAQSTPGWAPGTRRRRR
jgi:hypothetical protein